MLSWSFITSWAILRIHDGQRRYVALCSHIPSHFCLPGFLFFPLSLLPGVLCWAFLGLSQIIKPISYSNHIEEIYISKWSKVGFVQPSWHDLSASTLLNNFTIQNKVVYPNHFSEMVPAKLSLLILKLDLGNVCIVLIHIAQTHARDVSNKLTVWASQFIILFNLLLQVYPIYS